MAESEQITMTIDGVRFQAEAGSTVAAAILNSGGMTFRKSVTGGLRAPLCGMGICFECRVKINGEENVRSCLEPVREGMEVVTGG